MDLAKINQRKSLAKNVGGDRYEVKDGPNNIRVFAFIHTITADDAKKGFYESSKVGKKEKEIDRPVVIHFNAVKDQKRPVLSNPKLIANYEAVKAAKGDEAARKIGPQTKFAINLVDMDEKPRKMRHWLAPKSVYNKILNKMSNKDWAEGDDLGAKLLGCKGRDFVITFDDAKSGTEKYDVELRDKEFCVVLNSELDGKVRDFYSPKGWEALGIIDMSAPAKDAEEATEEEPATEEGETPAEEKEEAAAEETAETTEEVAEETPATEEAAEETEAAAEEEPAEEAEEEEETPPAKPAKPATKPGKPATKVPAKPPVKGKKPAKERAED